MAEREPTVKTDAGTTFCVHRDLPYAQPPNPRQMVDLYDPASGQGHPILFWIHGGGWQFGDRTEVDAKPQAFTDRGYVFISAGYRLFPETGIKEMARDVARGIRWTHDHAKEFGGDPSRIIVAGHSAGAQLAALICTDDRYLKAEGLSYDIIKGCVPVDGDTYDVPLQMATVEKRRYDIYRPKFGDMESRTDLSPITHVAGGKGSPPFLFLHVADHPETKTQAERIAAKLKEANVEVSVFPADGKTHVTLNTEIGIPGDAASQAFFDFADRVVKRSAG